MQHEHIFAPQIPEKFTFAICSLVTEAVFICRTSAWHVSLRKGTKGMHIDTREELCEASHAHSLVLRRPPSFPAQQLASIGHFGTVRKVALPKHNSSQRSAFSADNSFRKMCFCVCTGRAFPQNFIWWKWAFQNVRFLISKPSPCVLSYVSSVFVPIVLRFDTSSCRPPRKASDFTDFDHCFPICVVVENQITIRWSYFSFLRIIKRKSFRGTALTGRAQPERARVGTGDWCESQHFSNWTNLREFSAR